MSGPDRSDEIDDLVSSVRDFVAHKEYSARPQRVKSELLVLTPAHRVQGRDTSLPPLDYTSSLGPNVHRFEPPRAHDAPTLEETAAEFETAVTAQTDEFEPDEGESFAQDAWAASAFPETESPEPASEPASEVASTPPVASEPEEPRQKSADLSEMIAQELDAAFAAKPEDTPKQAARGILDEMSVDILRNLVSEIIREELAGALGEKITRNVRKLVQREINRALMARGID